MLSKLTSLLFFVFLFFFFLHPFEGSGDFYHHVNTGRWIIEHGSLPYLDNFSHTANGLPWVAYAWLSGLIFYIILKIFGELGISILASLAAFLTFVLLYHLLKSYQIPKKAIFLNLFLSAAPISIRWPQRPEIFYYPIAVAILLIDTLRIKKPYLAIFYPFLILLWANIYGSSAIAGLVILILLTLKQLIKDRFKITPSSKLFYLSCIASLPISLINGYGFKSIFYLFLYIPKVSLYEGEWAGIFKIFAYFPLNSLVIYQYYILIYFLYLAVFLLSIALFAKNLGKYKFFTILSFALIIPFFALRHTPIAIILSIPLLAASLTHHLKLKRYIFIAFIISIGIIMILISLWINPLGFIYKQNPALTKMITFIKDNNISGKAFNHTHLGGFITYELYPKVLVFYDTRDELYLKTDALKDLYNAYVTGNSILPLLSKYKIDLVIADFITDSLSSRDIFYSKDWAVVYYQDRYILAIPKKVALQKNLTEIDFADPFSQIGAKGGLEQKAIEFYSAQPNSIPAQVYLASSLLNLDKVNEAIKILSDLNLGIGPTAILNSKDRDYLLAESYLTQGSCQMGKEFLDKTAADLKKILIFPIQREIPSKINKIWALYYLKCQKDQIKSKEYLNLYLNQTNITPLEKLKTSNEFNTQSQ